MMRSSIKSKEGYRRWLWRRLSVCLLVGVVLAPGCGPSRQEIMAMEQARIAAEAERARVAEVKRQEEEARVARIRAEETAGNEAAGSGRFEKALGHYRTVLNQVPRYDELDQRVRQAVIKMVLGMPAPPPIPDSVSRSMVRGEAKLKMGGTGSYEAAAREMEQAVLEAPWLANGYYNLGIVQENAEMFGQAIQNQKLYLIASPRSRNANAVQAKIYELEVLQEDQAKVLALAGT